MNKLKEVKRSDDILRDPFEKIRKSLFVAVGAKRFTNFANYIRDKGK